MKCRSTITNEAEPEVTSTQKTKGINSLAVFSQYAVNIAIKQNQTLNNKYFGFKGKASRTKILKEDKIT